MTRRPFIPTDEQRRMVRAMAGYGVPQEDIALVIKCSDRTLRKRFRHELDVATIEANARVAQCLYQQATTPGNIAATIFWMKARAGWREVQRVETSGPDGAPIATEVVFRWAGSDDEAQKAIPAPAKVIEGTRA
ncbi:MAG: hypothetical protein JSS43_13565 [Proteobacteria bacterium]|nr:hypothetical protein [Pseudomonadota bacterium]